MIIGIVRNSPLSVSRAGGLCMEKPSPEYFISSGINTRTTEDRDARERYADRMTLRGIAVLRDTTEENEPPVWRGDHSFSSDAASYSLINFIEPEVAREHPQWTVDQVKQAAVERFEKRLAQDLSYEHKEIAHEESVVHWQPVQTAEGNWELATAYGDKMVTLSELWEHTRQYAEFTGNPAAYNPEEHKAQITMQNEFIDGSARGFVSVLSHPDAVRYVQVWQKTDDGSVVSKQVDLYKTTGRDFTHEEGEKFIEHLASFHNEQLGSTGPDAAAYAHFFIYEKEVHDEDIRTIAIAQAMEYYESVSGENISSRKTLPDMGSTIARDMSHSMVELGTFLREQIDRKINQFASPKEKSDKQPAVKDGRLNVSTKSPTEVSPLAVAAAVRSERVGIAVAPTTASSESMKVIAAEWWITKSLLRYKESAAVVPAAIILWLTAPRETPRLVIPEAALFRKKTPDEILPQKPPGKEKKKPLSVRTIMGLLRGLNEKKAGKRVLRTVPVEAGQVRQATRELLQQQSSGEKVTKVFPAMVMEKLLRMLRHFSRDVTPPRIKRKKISGNEAPPPPVILKESVSGTITEDEKKIYMTARSLSIAVIVWWLVDFGKYNQAYPAEAVKASRNTDTTQEFGVDAGREPSWLLLSIIWYLTALREHGKPRSTPLKKNKKKKKDKPGAAGNVSWPSSGVIFVYGS